MTRTQDCGHADAKIRLDQARHFLEVAQVVEDDDLAASMSVSAALCVLAGIAASDAACCLTLGERARGQDHREAQRLVSRVPTVGREMASSLKRLLELKDDAHYGMLYVSRKNTEKALRHANRLVDLAEQVALVTAGRRRQDGR